MGDGQQRADAGRNAQNREYLTRALLPAFWSARTATRRAWTIGCDARRPTCEVAKIVGTRWSATRCEPRHVPLSAPTSARLRHRSDRAAPAHELLREMETAEGSPDSLSKPAYLVIPFRQQSGSVSRWLLHKRAQTLKRGRDRCFEATSTVAVPFSIWNVRRSGTAVPTRRSYGTATALRSRPSRPVCAFRDPAGQPPMGCRLGSSINRCGEGREAGSWSKWGGRARRGAL